MAGSNEDNSSDSLFFPLHKDIPICKEYYPYGNTPAEDLLESCIGERRPLVLLLGCGDLRSCLYTLWKNFHPSIPDSARFDGVHFTLNDYSAAVLARNIIFLYLCLKLPSGTERKKWLSAMWSIWYCHELYPYHLEILNQALSVLASFSSSLEKWSSPCNPLQSIVQFPSLACLTSVAKCWKMWRDHPIPASVEQMHEARRDPQAPPYIGDTVAHSLLLTKGCVLIHGESEQTCQTKIHARSEEVLSYIKTGSLFAESVFNLILPESADTCINPTMYDSPDGKYSCQRGLIPFICFYHTHEFILQQPSDAFVPESSFKSKPFLANSVQQFSLWNQCASKILKDNKFAVSFRIDCQDAITFCHYKMQNKTKVQVGALPGLYEPCTYDIITTSNLMDHVGCTKLVLACASLMKPKSLLFTSTMQCRYHASSRMKFLDLKFGFSCQLFPVVLGLRCINQEGAKYASSVTSIPTLPDISHDLRIFPHNRIFLWEKVSGAEPLKFSELPNIGNANNITEALLDAIKGSLNPVLESIFSELPSSGSANITTEASFKDIEGTISEMPSGSTDEVILDAVNAALSNISELPKDSLKQIDEDYLKINSAGLKNSGQTDNCSELSILMLEQFRSVSSKCHLNFTFWERLATSLKEVSSPSLHCLQTQALLHNIHIHLTVTENECPLCKKIPLESFLGLFSALIPFASFQSGDLSIAVLHRSSSKGRDAYIFDSFDAIVSTDSTIQFRFFAPRLFVQRDYNITFLSLNRSSAYKISKLRDLQVPWKYYSFMKPCMKDNLSLPILHNKMFGKVATHICDSHSSKTEISLTNKAFIEMCSNPVVRASKVSPFEICISTGSFEFLLQVCYPISHATAEIDLSTSLCLLTISCHRTGHNFVDERPCCMVNPDHQLSLPSSEVDRQILIAHSLMQTNLSECQPVKISSVIPELTVKSILAQLFTTEYLRYRVHGHYGNQIGFVIINKLLYDYQHRTPAIDLAFCFPDQEQHDTIKKAWEEDAIPSKTKSLILKNNEEFDLLKSTFLYFAKRTSGNTTSNTFIQCNSHDLCHTFSRAVVYFLLSDPDIKLQGYGEFIQGIRENAPKLCSNCCYSNAKETCHFLCKKDYYCSKMCRELHWKFHKDKCYNLAFFKQDFSLPDTYISTPEAAGMSSNITNYYLSLCTSCKNMASFVKRCSACKSAQFCKSCREKYWPEHQNSCPCKDQSKEHIRCSCCDSVLKTVLKCSKCKGVQYCSPVCQKNHWPEHKKICISRSNTTDETN